MPSDTSVFPHLAVTGPFPTAGPELTGECWVSVVGLEVMP